MSTPTQPYNINVCYSHRHLFQGNQKGLEWNGTYQLLIYADDANFLDKSMHTKNKGTQAFLFDSKEIGV
jgi:hypothetical protein